ncbi:MAG: hypothetical protein F4221_05590 [Rhodothermaceae bacterium]|nr:hypothetical protein [Rhodothermaceae bacterium]
MRIWALISALLLVSALEVHAQRVIPDPVRPVRVMQEVPWAVSTSGWRSSMQPVRTLWDQMTEAYYMDLVAFFDVLDFQTEIDGEIVRSRGGGGVYEIDFERETATFSVDGIVEYEVEFSEGGVIHGGSDYLLTLPNIKSVLPPGALEYDEATLTVTLSSWVFARNSSPFRLHSIPPVQYGGPLLYGRERKLLGHTQLGYRMSRYQRPENEVTYNGYGQIQASALGGRIYANGTLRSDATLEEVQWKIRSANYLLDFPNFPVLRRFEAGRNYLYVWPVRKQIDGFRLSNLPLSTRNMQHESEIKGVTEPNAIVSASVDGVVVDRVQADGRGRYVLRVPARYGTSQAQIEISPLGGGAPTIETRYLFIPEDLTPPGVAYWDLRGGRDPGDLSTLAHGRMRYGISKRFSASGGFVLVDSLYSGILGMTTNLWGFLNVSGEISYPETSGRVALSMVRGKLRVRGEAELADRPGLSFYRRRLQGQIGTGLQFGSIFLNGSAVESFAGNESVNLNVSGMMRLSNRMNLLFTGGTSSTRSSFTGSSRLSAHWKSTLTRYQSIGRIYGRVGFQGDGGRYESIDFAGVTVYSSYRGVSLGMRFGYDFSASNVSASINLRLDAPWMSFNSYSSLDPVNPYHRQSMYGSVELGREVRFSRKAHAFSSVIFRAFLDSDRDGRWDEGEQPYSGLSIDVAKARVAHTKDGNVRADFLVPSSQYEVSIDPNSIKEPRLFLSTGSRFSFMSDPGETKYIDIPIYEETIIEGTIQNLPLSSPSLAVVVFYQEQEEMSRAAVSQQGRFTSLLSPGAYRIEVIDLSGQEDLQLFTQDLTVESGSIQYVQIQPN